MKSLAECTLYTFVDTAYLAGRPVEEATRALCNGGSDIIQLRAKNSSKAEVRRMVEQMLAITRHYDVLLVVNDHFDVARETGAEFCHLGQEDFFDAGIHHVNELRGNAQLPLIGLSTHASEQAQRAMAASADYLAIGPVYATPTKPTAQPVTLDYVRWAAKKVSLPWFAIGGINASNIHQVLEAGASRICLVSAILQTPNIQKACSEFRAIIPRNTAPTTV
jgi:thiamine-phosphate pyrophosphorylase